MSNLFNTQISDVIFIIKIFFISICTYYTVLKIFSVNSILKELLTSTIIIIIISMLYKVIRVNTNYFVSIIFLILSISILYAIRTRNNVGYSIIINTISLGINYVIYFVSIVITFFPSIMFKINNDYIGLFMIITIYLIILRFIFKIRRLKHGIIFIKNKVNNEYFDILILNISVTSILIASILNNLDVVNKNLASNLFISLIIFTCIMFITIQKTLTMYYKHKLLVKDLEETKVELNDAKEEITRLEQENLNFSKTSHSISHKQKILEHKLNELMMKNETSSEIDIKNELDKISKEYYKDVTTTELSKTDIVEIDDTLEYMKSECIKNNIIFELQVHENIYYMINHYISKEELQILLADHIKDAIIAIQHSENINRSILVRIGLIDGCYGIYIYDSGIEFEIDTLLKLGEIPITTHASEGGTGMGFLNTFDTIRKHNASLIINEIGKPCKDNYTKVIMIKFDQKNSFRIKSYRSEEIKKHDENKKLYIEE